MGKFFRLYKISDYNTGNQYFINEDTKIKFREFLGKEKGLETAETSRN